MELEKHTLKELLNIDENKEFVYFDDLIKYLEEKQQYLDNIYLIIRDLQTIRGKTSLSFVCDKCKNTVIVLTKKNEQYLCKGCLK